MVDVWCETSVGPRLLRYDPTVSQVETHGSPITFPLRGDFAGSRVARWQLVALDPAEDLAAVVADATMNGGRATLGRLKRIRVMGEQIGLGKHFWWSRMPERIYTAGLGEWSLAARWNTDLDPEASPVRPYYMMRHRQLHRNGRFDVTGFSPLDGERQNSQVQQFSPYGLLVAEGEVTPAGVSSMDDVPTSTMNETHRSRVLALGLTGKQYDPETQLYYFGYRWYSPELRRWTQREPLGLDGPNLYHFSFSSPSSRADLNGLQAPPVTPTPAPPPAGGPPMGNINTWWNTLVTMYSGGIVARPFSASMLDRFVGGALGPNPRPLGGDEDISPWLNTDTHMWWFSDMIFNTHGPSFILPYTTKCDCNWPDPGTPRLLGSQSFSGTDSINTAQIEAHSDDLASGIGEFSYSYEVTYEVIGMILPHATSLDTRCAMVVRQRLRITIRNAYNWDPGRGFNIPVVGLITSAFMNQGIQWGVAADFNMVADITREDLAYGWVR